MNDLRYKFSQFMQGRYGMDQLYYALLVVYLILLVLNMIFRRIMVFGILSWIVLIFAFYRFFSRNVSKRSRENDKFMALLGRFSQNYAGCGGSGNFGRYNSGNFSGRNCTDLMTRIREFPEKKYTSCPKCKATLRLPRRRGKHTVRCPRCGNRFGINIIIGKK